MSSHDEINDTFLFACCKGQKDIVEQMIEKGANNWNKGLLYSCRIGYRDIAELMIKNGATNLDEALYEICKQGHTHMAKLLIENGAKNLIRALIRSCIYNNKEMILLLIEKGAPIDLCYPLNYIDIEYLIIKKFTDFHSQQSMANECIEKRNKMVKKIIDLTLLNKDLVNIVMSY